LDLILEGNFYGSRLKFGHLDANSGVLLLGRGDGSLISVPNLKSGLFLNGEVRDIIQLTIATGNEIVLFASNNDSLQIYLMNEKPSGF